MLKKYNIIFGILIIGILIFASFYINKFRVDASSDTLVSQNDADFKFYNYYQKIFPTKNSLIIAVKSKKIIDNNLLNEIKLITSKLNKIPEIESVFSINNAPILFLNNTSLFDLSNGNFETIQSTKYDINDVLNEFADSPIYKDQIINNNKNITSIILFLKPNINLQKIIKNKEKYISDNTYYKIKTEIDEKRNELIYNIRTIISEANEDYTYYLGGIEMISNDVITFVKNDIFVFSFLVILLVLIILFLIFKKVKWVFVVISSSIFAVYLMIGLSGFLNYEITAISANFISLMFILSTSMNIHILNHYLQSQNNIKNTLMKMFWPCFYTFLTTVVAFISLIISDIKPVIDFGIIMIMALIIIIVNSFTILPFLISLFKKEKNENIINLSVISIFYEYSFKYKKYILSINFFIFLMSLYGITNLNVENSFIKYFKKNTEIYQGMELIDSELGGTTPLDIILKFKDENFENNKNNEIIDEENAEFDDDIFNEDIFNEDIFNDNTDIWFDNEKISTIRKIHKFLENRDEIGKVNSIYSLIEVAEKINKGNISTFELSILYNEVPEEYKKDLIGPYLNIDNNSVKIAARVQDSKEINREKLISEINNYISNNFENLEEFKANGLLVLYNNMLSSLFTSQIKSLGFVLLAIFVMFIILFRSLTLSIVGIIPNILACSFIIGLIGLLKIPLDLMTITIAAISIGIAVDNTIHYLYRYKVNMNEKSDYLKSIKDTHVSVGRAVMITSMALSLGFLTMCFSNFVPTIIFGLFTSLAMVFAMIGVLITLPSILYYFK